jgi:fused signal recognition particle receptor
MVFNWFRRQFNPSETPSENPAPEESIAIPPETAEPIEAVEAETAEEIAETPEEIPEPAPAQDPEAPPAVSADTLAWAKAAYENIKKQQTETAAPAEVPAAEPASPSLEETTPATPPEVEGTEPVSEITVPTEKNPEPISLLERSANETDDDTPAWAKESVQDRLAALKEQSIEAPVEAEIQLDEDFLWSARVLADQGRSPEEVALEEIAWLKKLRQGLNKTRLGLVNQVKALIGQGPLSADAEVAIETLLLQADVGIEATDYIIKLLQTKLKDETLPPEEAIAYLKQILRDLLDKPYEQNYNPEFVPTKDTLNIWLLTGVNGVGKTTTIGKLAHMSKESGYRCLIAAADTFRAAAVEQVKVWGERSGIEVIANPGQNTDPAAVVFDAISAAKSRNIELLLVDTAGRLQNKKNLMDELSKIRRVVDKQSANAQIESLLVLDATLGQNGLRQAQVFAEAAKLSGVVLTKLDGTARGGVALAVVQQLGLPIRFIGAGEGIEDLRPFSSYEFVEALLSS